MNGLEPSLRARRCVWSGVGQPSATSCAKLPVSVGAVDGDAAEDRRDGRPRRDGPNDRQPRRRPSPLLCLPLPPPATTHVRHSHGLTHRALSHVSTICQRGQVAHQLLVSLRIAVLPARFEPPVGRGAVHRLTAGCRGARKGWTTDPTAARSCRDFRTMCGGRKRTEELRARTGARIHPSSATATAAC